MDAVVVVFAQRRGMMNHGDRVFVKFSGQLVPGVVDAVLPPYVAVLMQVSGCDNEPVAYLLNARSVIPE